jgi:hypothetical protein
MVLVWYGGNYPFYFIFLEWGCYFLSFLSGVWGVERETSVFPASVPKEMGIVSRIVRVAGVGRDGLQERLLRRPQVLLHSPQEGRVLAVCLRIVGLHPCRPLEVILRSVYH